jgi:hypothetical protein
MSLADELQKLEQLRSSGALSEEEFHEAKTKLLSPAPEQRGFLADDRQDSLGKAANRYVSLQMILAVVGIIIFLIVFFTVVLPMFSRMSLFGGFR